MSCIHKNLLRFPLLMASILLTSCGGGKQKEAQKPATPKDYAVLTLQPTQATTFNDYPATVQGENVVEIRPMVDGYLEEIYVQEGANVRKGQMLFKIKNPQYDQQLVTANAAIKIAQADVNAAKMDVEKVRPLVAKDIVSKFELESARYTLQSREAALAQANATLENAKTNVGYTLLRSPVEGVMGSIPYKIGALVSSSTADPLTTLSSIGNVYAYFALNEKQVLNFTHNVPGNTMQEKLNHLPAVTLILSNGTEYNEKGQLQTASGLITTETGTASFKAIFPNPQGIIRSGASATVRIPRTLDTALLIPQSASYELQDKRLVYTLTRDNRVLSTAIVSQPTNDGHFLIVQSGLKRGDRVVINGTNIKDSTQIIPRPVNTDSLFATLSRPAGNQ